MREGTSKHLALLGVEFFEISNNFIYKLRESHPRPDNIFKFLPTYTINTNKDANNKIVVAEEFHQFIGMMKHNEDANEKYVYFNLNTVDATLNEEISNSGMEYLFKNFNFKHLLRFFKPEDENNISNFVFPNVNYLVVELTYTTSYDHYSGGYDCEMEIDIVGFLNSMLQLQYFQ